MTNAAQAYQTSRMINGTPALRLTCPASLELFTFAGRRLKMDVSMWVSRRLVLSSFSASGISTRIFFEA
jgi:hypothetical protein